VAGVDEDVEEHLLDLPGVRLHRADVVPKQERGLDPLPRFEEQLRAPADQVVHGQGPDLVFPAPREPEELPRQVGAALHVLLDLR